MKLFRNIGKNGSEYYSTSFYKKDLGGNILKKPIYVRFQKGTAPLMADEYDLEIKAYVNGVEYDVLLDAYDKNGQTEGALFFGKFGERNPAANEKVVPVEEYQSSKSEELNLNAEDLPFY